MVSSSSRFDTGQPRSSWSTLTWSAMGVLVASVEIHSGRAYTVVTYLPMSAELRKACTPPAVAHAPMVISSPERARTSTMRSASCAVVIDPSTSEMS